MELNAEPKPVLAICLNPAWERTLYFKEYKSGGVNRAYKMAEHGGGKGINSLRALRCLGVPARVAAFCGGSWGAALKGEVGEDGLWVEIAQSIRGCFEIIDESCGAVTEIIEPSPAVTESECAIMLQLLESAIPESGAVACCGTFCNGVTAEMAASIVRIADRYGIPFLMDAKDGIGHALMEHISLLKVNDEEICALAGERDVQIAANLLLKRYSRLDNVAVTAGSGPAMLFTRGGSYKYIVPHLDGIVSPIGCGDCATAVMLRRMSETHFHIEEAFAEALACASASCLYGCPSFFNPMDAASILDKIERMPL